MQHLIYYHGQQFMPAGCGDRYTGWSAMRARTTNAFIDMADHSI